MRLDPPFLKVFSQRVVLWSSLRFLLKVISKFRLSQEIILPIFSSSLSSENDRALHLLDVRKTLLFYLKRTLGFLKKKALFVCFTAPNRGKRASPQTLSCWIVSTIKGCYAQTKLACPLDIHANLTRKMGSSAAFFDGIPWLRFVELQCGLQWRLFVCHYVLIL